jgi:hypothetical protein
MITAQEAKAIANQISSLESQNQLKDLDQAIWGAAVLGKLQVDIAKMSLLPCVVEYVERAGYHITQPDEFGSELIISW